MTRRHSPQTRSRLDVAKRRVPVVDHRRVHVGESWAYRARSVDPLVAVRVRRVGTKKPARVLVRFLDEEFEGQEEWVPPARLKVLWCDVESYRARERRWARVMEASPVEDTAEHFAALTVFDALIDPSVATVGYNRTSGVTTIHDVDALASLVNVEPARLRADPASFSEDGALVVPWATTELIVRRAADADPDPILRQVDNEEDEHRHKTVYGEDRPPSRHSDGGHLPAEWFVEHLDQPYNRPCWNLLRRWCGAQAVRRRDELVELRRELAHVRQLAHAAIVTLRAAGERHAADRLERGLASRVPKSGR
jgi:hypothetical protein